MENTADFVKRAIAYYESKFEEEKKRWGVLAISSCGIDSNSSIVVDERNGAGNLWQELATQSGLFFHVNFAPGDPQVVYAILSKESVLGPDNFYKLFELLDDLKLAYDVGERCFMLENYDGPYRLETPEQLERILTVDNVEHVYIGARGACCCGCSGHHIYHNTNPMLNEIGYMAINNHGEVDDELFEKTIQLINDSSNRKNGDNITSVEIGNELLIAYLHREK